MTCSKRRIDLRARDVLEYLLAARLVDRHRVAQLAVDVHRHADDVLAVEQRKLQLAFELARFGLKNVSSTDVSARLPLISVRIATERSATGCSAGEAMTS